MRECRNERMTKCRTVAAIAGLCCDWGPAYNRTGDPGIENCRMSESRMRKTIHAPVYFAAILTLAFFATLTVAADNSAEVERLRDDVRTLASDDFDGRGVGTAGLEKAAEYVRAPSPPPVSTSPSPAEI